MSNNDTSSAASSKANAAAQANARAAADKKKAANLDPAHVMDFSNLHLDHAPSSKTVVTIVDLDVYVYGLEEIKNSTRPIAVAVRSELGES